MNQKRLYEFYEIIKSDRIVIFSYLIFVAWCAAHFIYDIEFGDRTQLSRSVYFLIYTLVGSSLFYCFYDKEDDFVRSVFVACLIQAIFVYITFLWPGFKYALAEIVEETGNIPILSIRRVSGFSNGASSALSLLISIGVFCGMYLYIQTPNLIKKFFYLMLTLFILCSILLVGRMGLVIGCYFLVTLVIYSFRVDVVNFIVMMVLLLFSLIVIGPYIYEALNNHPYFIGVFGDRLMSINNAAVRTIDALVVMNIPPLTLENIFWGNSRVRGEFGNASGSDIGYIQTYFAVGLVMTMYFYIFFFIVLAKRILKLKHPFYAIVLSLPIFIIEFKEPYLFKYMYPFFVLCFIKISNKSMSEVC